MLKRFFFQLSLVLLFAFTQIGIAAHEISHLSEHANNNPSQQDKKSEGALCITCASFAHAVAHGLAHPFVFNVATTHNTFAVVSFSSFQSSTPLFYCARAPPQHFQT